MKLTAALIAIPSALALPALPANLATWVSIVSSILALPVPSGYAADFGGPQYKEPPAQYANWTGFAVFGFVGYGHMDANTGFSGTDNLSNLNINFANTIGLPLNYDMSGGGVLGGGGLSFDWQTGQWIFGANTQWTFLGLSQSANGVASLDTSLCGPGGCGAFGGNKATLATTAAIKQYGTTQLEVGYIPVVGVPLAIFAHGGVAYGDISKSDAIGLSGPIINFFGGPFGSVYNYSETKFGPVVGAKIEYMLTTHWVAGVDYEHVFFGSLSNQEAGQFGTFQSSTSLNLDVVKAEIKYKF
jgi:outer membrane immunogenic protein